MMQVILLERYLLVVTGLLAFFIAFFMSKEKNKYITIGICAIIVVMSSFNCYYTIKGSDSDAKNIPNHLANLKLYHRRRTQVIR